jgi:hypothetical protein
MRPEAAAANGLPPDSNASLPRRPTIVTTTLDPAA